MLLAVPNVSEGRDHAALDAIARAFAAGEERSTAVRALAAVSALVDGLPDVTAARLVVAPRTAAALEGRLPELARLTGFPISVEVADEGRLPTGGMRLLWDGGWAEHDPADIGHQIERLLAAHGAPEAPREADGGTESAGVDP